MDPDVSTASMKYGFEGAGHCAGLGERHAGGSAADTGSAKAAAARAATRIAVGLAILTIGPVWRANAIANLPVVMRRR
jgi:hypothetical protein